jgi:hypothetical protein
MGQLRSGSNYRAVDQLPVHEFASLIFVFVGRGCWSFGRVSAAQLPGPQCELVRTPCFEPDQNVERFDAVQTGKTRHTTSVFPATADAKRACRQDPVRLHRLAAGEPVVKF